MLLHASIPTRRGNGPGLRAVVFFQGYSIGCAKCWNPKTHQFHGTEGTVDGEVQKGLKSRREHSLEGVTFSGGEPMEQANSLLSLLHSLRQRAPALSFGMFRGDAEHELATGQCWMWGDGSSEQHRKSLWQGIRCRLDFAILGRFNQAQPGHVPVWSKYSIGRSSAQITYDARSPCKTENGRGCWPL